MNSQLYTYCRILAIGSFVAGIFAALLSLASTQPGPVGLCIASALVLGMSLIAMAVLQLGDRKKPPSAS